MPFILSIIAYCLLWLLLNSQAIFISILKQHENFLKCERHACACINKNENKNFKFTFEFLWNRKFENVCQFQFHQSKWRRFSGQYGKQKWICYGTKQMALRFIHHDTHIEASFLELSKTKLLHGITFDLLASVWSIAKKKCSSCRIFCWLFLCGSTLQTKAKHLHLWHEMDDEAETYKLWRIRKTVMQVCCELFPRCNSFSFELV